MDKFFAEAGEPAARRESRPQYRPRTWSAWPRSGPATASS